MKPASSKEDAKRLKLANEVEYKKRLELATEVEDEKRLKLVASQTIEMVKSKYACCLVVVLRMFAVYHSDCYDRMV